MHTTTVVIQGLSCVDRAPRRFLSLSQNTIGTGAAANVRDSCGHTGGRGKWRPRRPLCAGRSPHTTTARLCDTHIADAHACFCLDVILCDDNNRRSVPVRTPDFFVGAPPFPVPDLAVVHEQVTKNNNNNNNSGDRSMIGALAIDEGATVLCLCTPPQ